MWSTQDDARWAVRSVAPWGRPATTAVLSALEYHSPSPGRSPLIWTARVPSPESPDSLRVEQGAEDGVEPGGDGLRGFLAAEAGD